MNTATKTFEDVTPSAPEQTTSDPLTDTLSDPLTGTVDEQSPEAMHPKKQAKELWKVLRRQNWKLSYEALTDLSKMEDRRQIRYVAKFYERYAGSPLKDDITAATEAMPSSRGRRLLKDMRRFMKYLR